MAEYTVDKIEYGGNVYNLSPNVVYATCPTAAATAAKVATITSGTLTSLNTGDQVIVKFTYANGKASPTLKVGSTDAKSIMRYGTTAPGTSAASSWNAGSCVLFVYDGTYWQQIGFLNSTYTVTDKKLEIGAVTSGTTYYPIVGNGTTAATRQYDSTGFEYEVFTGTTEAQGGAGIRLGNSTATGTDGNKKGFITIYGTGSNSSTLYGPSGGTGNYNVWLPNNGGILALTTDIPDVSGKIDTAGTGLSKSGTTLNHSNSVTAQTTQAVYPIKIDAQGHISAYGSAVTIPTVPANIVNTITTTAGTHTAITSQKGNVSFNVPTKTSHLTNDSGFITNAGVTSITTTAGAHTAITSATGAVSFKVPTTAAHVGAATSDHTHGNITNGGDITATAPTIASGDQIIINDHSASKITNGPTFDGSTTTTALTPKGTWESFAKSDTNTTYTLSGALSSHKFTSTLTAGGSGSGTSTSDFTLAAGTGITITDDTSNRKMTIACSVTNTDKRLEVSEATSGIFYYPILSTGTTVAETRSQDTTGFSYIGTTGSGSTSGTATFTIGNNIAGSSGKCGYLDIYGIGQYKATLRLGSALTANRLINLPNKDGTIALTSDVVPKPSDDGNFGWVLKYSTNSASFWDPPSGFRFFVKEDSENPGTYSFDGNLPENIQEAWTYGTSLVLELSVLNASDTYDTYTLTDYYAQEVPTEDGCYYVLWFNDVFKTTDAGQKQITVGIYLDDLEVEHTYGEITVTIDTVVSAGTDGSEGITIGGWKICWGSVSLTTASASGSGTYTSPYYASSSTISLNYTAFPYIWCQVQGEWTGTRYATPYDVSETGFKIRLYASHKNSTATSIRWLAIGKA